MKTKLLFLILASLLCTACHREPDVSTARRTILVYMVAKNSLGSSGWDEKDIGEMTQGQVPDDCRLLVFHTRYQEPPTLSEVTDGQLITLKTYGPEVVGADAQTLRQVLADTHRLRPAHSMGVVFWSHSSGWLPQKRVNSRSFGLEMGREIEIDDLAAALASAQEPIDFLLFDSCYMGCYEVARELHHTARYMVASVAEVPVDGMPYHTVLPWLFSADTAEGLKKAIDLTADSYAGRTGSYCPSTMALYNLRGMHRLQQSVEELLRTRRPLPSYYTPQRFSISSTYADAFVDLDAHMEAMAADQTTYTRFRDALTGVVLHRRHSPMIWGRLPIDRCCGLSVNPDIAL